jgi:hypothetical protein
VRYLVQRHDARPLLPLLPDSLRDRMRGGDEEARVRLAVTSLGAEYVTAWETGRQPSSPFNFTADETAPIPVAGYDQLLRLRPVGTAGATDSSLVTRLAEDGKAIEVRRGTALVIAAGLDSLIAALPAVQPMGPQPRRQARPPGTWFRIAAANDTAAIEVWLSSISGFEGRSGKRVTGATGLVLVSLRRAPGQRAGAGSR